MSEPLNELAAALAKAQARIKNAVKDSDNPAFRGSKYADLASVWDACRAPLTENGIAVIQSTDFDNDVAWIKTILVHSSGQKIEGRYPLRPIKNDPQGYGSALTYARRYCLAAMVGVAPDDDDDGNAASGRDKKTATNTARHDDPPPQPKPAALTPHQSAKDCRLYREHGLGRMTPAEAKRKVDFKALLEELYQTQSPSEVAAYIKTYQGFFDTWPEGWLPEFNDRIVAHENELAKALQAKDAAQ